MKKQLLLFAMILLPLVASAYDIAVENADGVTIFYNYTNDGKELEVTAQGIYSRTIHDSHFNRDYIHYYSTGYSNIDILKIPSEVSYMGRLRKVTSIGDHAFTNSIITGNVNSSSYKDNREYNKFTEIYLPPTIKKIAKDAFASYYTSTPSTPIPLERIHIEDLSQWCMMDFYKGYFHRYELILNETVIKDINIPNGITEINSWAFAYCGNLTSITIPNSVTSIGDSAFYGCSGLTSVTIPNSVTSIEEGVFFGCYGLTSVTIPNSVTSIGDGAFSDCYGLTSVTIPNSVTSIGREAFSDCYGLTSVTIPNSVTSIGNYAFYKCSSLTSITIPNSVTSIGDYAFYGCSGLTSVTIGNSVTSIGNRAFDGVDIPTVISLIENPFTIYGKTSDYRTFSQNTFYNATLYVPKGTIDKYKATDGWKDFVFIEEGTGGGDTPTTQKCEKPTISYENGKLTFSSATDGAVCQYSITDTDIKAGSGNEVQLGVTYNISVYATKSGYENSETATATLCWIDASPKTEGITNGVAQIAARPVLVKTDNGFITVEGVDDRTNVSVYTTDGKQVGSAISQNNTATIATSIQPGSIAIVKIGEKAIKVVMK